MESEIEQQEPASVWRVIGAAVQGTSHIKVGLPCQDAFGYRLLANGTLLAAVADGAGSAERSEQGARRAIEVSLETLAAGLESGLAEAPEVFEDLLRAAFDQARQEVWDLAENGDLPARAYATTLTLAVATEKYLAAGQVGDGAVVATNAEGEIFVVTHAQKGEYANETNFLVQGNALEHLEIQVVEETVPALALMSDGLTRLALKLPSYEPHVPFFKPLFSFLLKTEDESAAAEQLAQFLASDRVNARTDDDKSLILGIRQADPAQEAEPQESEAT